jgi:hypothetical protein
MFERIPEPSLEPPETEVFADCDWCGREIYMGEDYYKINRENVHEECLREYFSTCKQEADEYAETY